MNIDFLRTPDAAFENLPNWPYHPNYLEGLPDFGKVRLHFLDEGQRTARDFIAFMVNPWGYLYRKMIPVFETRSGDRSGPVWIWAIGQTYP